MTTPTFPSLKDRVTTVRDLFLANKGQIDMALPRHMSVDRMIRTALTSLSTVPGLLDCTPRSLLGAVIQAAQLGLEPGVLGHVYLLPFHNSKKRQTEVQLLIGYKGLIQLARRSGEISTIQAHAVHAQDKFKRTLGTQAGLVHEPAEATEPGPITHFYAVARLKDGGVQFEVMTTGEIAAHRDRYSRAAKQGPWVTNYEEMAKKTVLRRLCKLLPASVELQRAVALDELAEVQVPQDLTIDLDPEPEAANGSALDALTEQLTTPGADA